MFRNLISNDPAIFKKKPPKTPKNKKTNKIRTKSKKSGVYEGFKSGRGRFELHCGLIDILQQYTSKKKAEHVLKSVYYKASTVSVTHHDFYAQRFFSFMTKDVFKNDPSEARINMPGAPNVLNRRGSKSRAARPTPNIFNTPRNGTGGGSKLALGKGAAATTAGAAATPGSGGGDGDGDGDGDAGLGSAGGVQNQAVQGGPLGIEARKQEFLSKFGEQLQTAKAEFGIDIAAFVYDLADSDSVAPRILGSASALGRARAAMMLSREIGEKQYFDVEPDNDSSSDAAAAAATSGAGTTLKLPAEERLTNAVTDAFAALATASTTNPNPSSPETPLPTQPPSRTSTTSADEPAVVDLPPPAGRRRTSLELVAEAVLAAAVTPEPEPAMATTTTTTATTTATSSTTATAPATVPLATTTQTPSVLVEPERAESATAPVPAQPPAKKPVPLPVQGTVSSPRGSQAILGIPTPTEVSYEPYARTSPSVKRKLPPTPAQRSSPSGVGEKGPSNASTPPGKGPSNTSDMSGGFAI